MPLNLWLRGLVLRPQAHLLLEQTKMSSECSDALAEGVDQHHVVRVPGAELELGVETSIPGRGATPTV